MQAILQEVRGQKADAPEGIASEDEARLRECQTIFAQYDKNRSGMLEFDELRSALGDLGLLVSPGRVGTLVCPPAVTLGQVVVPAALAQ